MNRIRTLGRTGESVGVLGLGGAQIAYRDTAQTTVGRILDIMTESGMNVIDTAECYPNGEEKIGLALAGRRDRFFLMTKLGHSQHRDLPDWSSPSALRASVDRSLKRLRTDYVDMIQIHSCPLEWLRRDEVLSVVQQAQISGKTRFVGYAGDGIAVRHAIQCGVFDAIQTSVGVADQGVIDDGTLALARSLAVGILAKRPLSNCAWQYRRRPDLPDHAEYWARFGQLPFCLNRIPAAEAVRIALRFTLGQDVDVALVGTTSPFHWAENVESLATGPLPREDIDRMRSAWRSAMVCFPAVT